MERIPAARGLAPLATVIGLGALSGHAAIRNRWKPCSSVSSWTTAVAATSSTAVG